MACHHSNRAEEAAKHRRSGGIAGFSRRGGIKTASPCWEEWTSIDPTLWQFNITIENGHL